MIHGDEKKGGKTSNARSWKQLSSASSQIVSEAAALLDDEIAAGVVSAKAVQERFQKERRIDPADFKGALQRFQRDAHEVVNLLNDQLGELRSGENAEHTARLLRNGHDLIDLTVGVVNMGAEIADQLTQANLPKKNAATARARAANGRRAERGFFDERLAHYRELTTRALLGLVPDGGPPHLYDLVSVYPSRLGKGLRAALCLATCGALGGDQQQALNSAVMIELFHNAFLIHDDVQDGSFSRRGGDTLHQSHGVGIAVNVGNATNLLAIGRLLANRALVGPDLSWQLVQETEQMMRQSLEGQAMELGWIRDNVLALAPRDYLQMCLKKTSWYSFIYPLRVGALLAGVPREELDRFGRVGWYVGAAFQIQDDLLNLTGDYARYGKEIAGDLREGKRTLMLVHLLGACSARERRALERILARPRAERDLLPVDWIYDLMIRYGSIEFARGVARQLAGAALMEALTVFGAAPDSEYKQFILEMVLYVVNRDK